MTNGKTSRRQFVRLAGGLALALRHGLLPKKAATGARQLRAVATLEDSMLCIEWDANLHSRVSRMAGQLRIPLTSFGPSEYLLRAGGPRIADFAVRHQARDSIADANGPGTRLTLSGISVDGVEKT